MYFFATPKIFGKQARGFRQDLADRFADVYVRGFGGLCAGLARTGRPVAVLYPSTVAIDAPLAELAEYAAAKLEGERLCARLSAEGPLTVLAPRLPRIETDQTLTLQPAEAADAVDVLLPLIRKMGAPKGPAAPGT
jgi:hypothetical protein